MSKIENIENTNIIKNNDNIESVKMHPVKFCKHITQCTASFIKSMRKTRNVHLKTIAKVLGVSIQQLGKYESGLNRISIGKLLLLCDFYQYDIHSFIKELLSYAGMNSNDKKYETLNFNNINKFYNINKLTSKQQKLINALINDLANLKS